MLSYLDLTIKTFDGNISEWCSFTTVFLCDIEKFNYMRVYLKDDTVKTIDGLILIAENYLKALEYLQEWCRKQDMIISRNMK